MRFFTALFIAITLAASSGCSSTIRLATNPEPFAGVRTDLEILKDPADHPVLATAALCDAPLSLAVDTVTLPVVLATGHTDMTPIGGGRAFD
ncbi:MAG: YceK/YidQ family lipoprotein [Planctomycetota bacterium]|nr:YceK/YidQ family lipoprotein [Planctomycetota bacterium]